jgi:hypothetical protein
MLQQTSQAPSLLYCVLTCQTGAQGIGLLSASLLRSTLEDFLVLAVAGMASYVAVLNLPLKRSEIKAKVGNRANNFVDGVAAAMAEVREAGLCTACGALSGLLCGLCGRKDKWLQGCCSNELPGCVTCQAVHSRVGVHGHGVSVRCGWVYHKGV